MVKHTWLNHMADTLQHHLLQHHLRLRGLRESIHGTAADRGG